MSIVNHVLDKLPDEGQLVYCDNPPFANDRAIFENGKFIGGGEFPVDCYEMKNVSKWFDYKLYCSFFDKSGINSYTISFDKAEKIET